MFLSSLLMLTLPLCTMTCENQAEVPPIVTTQEKTTPYHCAKCHLLLFNYEAKYATTNELLSFTRPIFPVNVTYSRLDTFTLLIAISCSGCSHPLGVIYDDGPAPIYKRFSVYSDAVIQH